MSASPRSRGRSPSPFRSRSRSRSHTRSSHSHSRSRSRSHSPGSVNRTTPDLPPPDTSTQVSRKQSDDLANTSPFLIRVFVRQGPGFHPVADFDEGVWPLRDEYGVWGWKSSTLPHLTSLLLPSLPPNYRSPVAKYTYKLLYVDTSQHELREVGKAPGGAAGGRIGGGGGQGPSGRGYAGIYRTKEMGPGLYGRELFQSQHKVFGKSAKTLEDLRFQSGDHLLLSITLPVVAGFGGAQVGAPGLTGLSNVGGRIGGVVGMSIAGAAGVRPTGANGIGSNPLPPRGNGPFSVFGASARGGGGIGGHVRAGAARGGHQTHDLLSGGVGAPENGSWKDAREANPGLRSANPRVVSGGGDGGNYRNITREREDRLPSRGDGAGGWRGRAGPTGGVYRERSPGGGVRGGKGRYFDRGTDLIAGAGQTRGRSRSASPARETRVRSRSDSRSGPRDLLGPRGHRRPSPEYS